MPTIAVVAAAVASLVGALLWALIAWKADLEIGWLAWGIGGAVGFAGARFGGSGVSSGVACGLLALLSIFGGKAIAVTLSLDHEIDAMLESALTQEFYQEQKTDAQAFAQSNPSDHRQFMIERGYTEAESADAIDDAEVADFEKFHVPALQKMSESYVSIEKWRALKKTTMGKAIKAEINMVDVFKETLSPFDLLWILLGVGTAFKLGSAVKDN